MLDHSPGSWFQEHECLEADEECVVTDVHPKPEQSRAKDQGEELIKVNTGEEGKEAQPISICDSLSFDLKEALPDLLNEFKDVYACTYAEMS